MRGVRLEAEWWSDCLVLHIVKGLFLLLNEVSVRLSRHLTPLNSLSALDRIVSLTRLSGWRLSSPALHFSVLFLGQSSLQYAHLLPSRRWYPWSLETLHHNLQAPLN